MLRLVRAPGETTPMEEPPDGHPQWPEMDFLAAVCHSGSPASGHWQAFCRREGEWWSVDPGRNAIFRRNPFESQRDLKIVMLLFKE